MELTDLHVHSTASDGTFTPSELVAEAKRIGLKAFALTDHDTVAGVKEATAAADEAGIELIPGIEISTKYNSTYIKDKEVHIVGLYIDYTNEHFLSEIAGYRDNRDGRNDKLIELMNEAGMSVSLEAMRDTFGDDTVLTRAHFARYMVSKGYVSSTNEAFDRYLGEGKPFYVSRQMPDPARAVELIHEAGGVAVLAHPILYKMSDSELMKLCQYLKRHGLNGIEGIYSTYRSGDETTIRRIAGECGLLISGGSDFHGANKPDIRLGIGRGNLKIPYELAVNLKKAVR